MSLAIANSNSIPTCRDIVSKKGRVVGQKFTFGTLTAREIRQAGRGMGLKGSALNEYVNDALHNEAAQRKAAGAVFLSVAESKGMLPDSADLRAGSGVLRLVMPKATKVETAKDKEIARLQAELEQLRKVQAVMALPVVG